MHAHRIPHDCRLLLSCAYAVALLAGCGGGDPGEAPGDSSPAAPHQQQQADTANGGATAARVATDYAAAYRIAAAALRDAR
jgi:predicted small lipoprotein YifL